MIADIVEASLVRGRKARGGKRATELEGITRVETLDQAVETAARLAKPGDVVLLSPGGTSFDAFRDFAERGDRFEDLVQQLGGTTGRVEE